METKEELKQLEEELREIRRSYKRNSSWLLLLTVVLVILLINAISFFIKTEIHNAVEKEDISGQIEIGFDRVMENYEVVED